MTDALSLMVGRHRFDPELRLSRHLEYWGWRPARLPATRRSWKARRAIGRLVEALAAAARKIAVGLEGTADLVHGQPLVGVRINWAADGARQLSRYVEKEITVPRRPFDPADLTFLAGYCRVMPETLDALDAELRAAALETMKAGG